MKCFICSKKLNNGDQKHVYYCAKISGCILSKSELRYKHICFNVGFVFTKEYFEDKYIKCKWSLPDFKTAHKLAFRQTQFLLNYFGINQRTHNVACNLEERSNKFKNTCKEKYGVSNVSQSNLVKDKKKKTFLKHYGVDNIWKSPTYYEWLDKYMRDKYGKGSLANRYGGKNKWWNSKTKDERSKLCKNWIAGSVKHWYSLSDEQRDEIIRKRSNSVVRNFTSKIETRVGEALKRMGLSYHWQFWITRKSFDYRINGTRKIIEVNGDFWHANPKIYKHDDIVSYPNPVGKIPAKQIWDRDAKKKAIAEKYGYSVIAVWEDEMKGLSDENLEILLFERLNLPIDNVLNGG